VLPGGLVRDFRKTANQLLEEVAHLDVGDGARMQVDLAEALENLPEDAAVLQAFELIGEQELVEKDVADVAGELGYVIDKILMELPRVLAFQGLEGETGQVVDFDVATDGRIEDHVPGLVIDAIPARSLPLPAAFFDASRMQSRRRRTTNGRMAFPYSNKGADVLRFGIAGGHARSPKQADFRFQE
jgi:hypothetical protein